MKLCNVSQSFKSQIFATVCVNIIALSYGMVIGWLSPVLPTLESVDSPLATGPLTVVQISWIGSLLCIGEALGAVLLMLLSYKIGAKYALICIGIIFTGHWILVWYASAYYLLYIARLASGFAGGGIYALVPLYVADIAEPDVRGFLGSIVQLFYACGILMSYVIGAVVEYHTFPLVTIIFPIIFILVVLYLPETPQALIKRNNFKKAECAFRFYRGINKTATLPNHFADEYKMIVEAKSVTMTNKQNVTFSDFKSKAAIKGLAIGISLMFFNQFCGCFVITTYAASIFKDAGSSLSPNVSAIITAIVQIAGTYVSTILVDKMGRKVLLIISMGGVTFGLGVCGLFSYFAHLGYDVKAFALIPVISLSFVIFVGCIGILTIPYVILAELLPVKIRSHGSMISLWALYAFSFIVVKLYPILNLYIFVHGCMWMFSAVCFFGMVFVMIFVQETKGKNLTIQ